MASRMLPIYTPAVAASRTTFSSPSPGSLFISPTSLPLRGGSFLGEPLSLRVATSPSLLPQRPQRRLASATAVSMLPSAKPERAASPEKKIKWSLRALKSFGMAELEARKLKYPNTGTETLLMGILVEGTNLAARFLRANGITLAKVREEGVKLLGKSDMFYFSPEHPPLTEPAQRALDWAVEEKLKAGEDGEVTTIHLLLGIWSQEDSAGHKILASFGFDNGKAEEIAKYANKDFEFQYR